MTSSMTRMCCLTVLFVISFTAFIKFARSMPARTKRISRVSRVSVSDALGEGDETDAYMHDDELSGDFEQYAEDNNQIEDVWKVNLNYSKADKTNLFEGDIRLTLLQKLHIKVQETLRSKRSARIPKDHPDQYLWKDNTIYYKIGKGLKKSTRTAIKRGIKHWKRALKGCLKFIRLDKRPDMEKQLSREKFNGLEVDHIEFSGEEPGCWSLVGRQGQRQIISIGDKGCANTGTVIHEIGHAVGFWHEQSRRDRDDYIKVLGQNIMEDQKEQFRRMQDDETDSMYYAYDFASIMHYGPKFFTKNGRHTIKIKKKFRYLNFKLGQREKLSFLDIAQVRAMYKCNAIPSPESQKTCIKRSTKGRDYRGELDYTEKGVMCQPWNEIYPHKPNYDWKDHANGLGKHNYCRNPEGSRKRPWCYTTLGPKKEEWQYCDLKFCD